MGPCRLRRRSKSSPRAPWPKCAPRPSRVGAQRGGSYAAGRSRAGAVRCSCSRESRPRLPRDDCLVSHSCAAPACVRPKCGVVHVFAKFPPPPFPRPLAPIPFRRRGSRMRGGAGLPRVRLNGDGTPLAARRSCRFGAAAASAVCTCAHERCGALMCPSREGALPRGAGAAGSEQCGGRRGSPLTGLATAAGTRASHAFARARLPSPAQTAGEGLTAAAAAPRLRAYGAGGAAADQGAVGQGGPDRVGVLRLWRSRPLLLFPPSLPLGSTSIRNAPSLPSVWENRSPLSWRISPLCVVESLLAVFESCPPLSRSIDKAAQRWCLWGLDLNIVTASAFPRRPGPPFPFPCPSSPLLPSPALPHRPPRCSRVPHSSPRQSPVLHPRPHFHHSPVA